MSAKLSREHFRRDREIRGLIHGLARSSDAATRAGSVRDRGDFYRASTDPHIQVERIAKSEQEHETLARATAQGSAAVNAGSMVKYLPAFGQSGARKADSRPQVDPRVPAAASRRARKCPGQAAGSSVHIPPPGPAAAVIATSSACVPHRGCSDAQVRLFRAGRHAAAVRDDAAAVQARQHAHARCCFGGSCRCVVREEVAHGVLEPDRFEPVRRAARGAPPCRV